jgi:hypothetical protein
MPSYKEENVSGKFYSKVVRFVAEVDGDDAGVTAIIERGFKADDGRIIKMADTQLILGINKNNSTEKYPLVNPTTKVALGTDGTFQELYVRLMSLVPYLASKEVA